MSGKCSAPGTPNWIDTASSYYTGDCRITGCAGIGKALAIAGIPPIYEGNLLTCCGRPPRTRTTGGDLGDSLLYEGLSSPPIYSFDVEPLDQRKWPSTIVWLERCRTLAGKGSFLFNPLGWPNQTPLRIAFPEGPRGCVVVGETTLSPTQMEPLQLLQTLSCGGLEGASRERIVFEVNGFKLGAEGRISSVGSFVVVEEDSRTIIYDRASRTLTIFSHGKDVLEIDTVLGEYAGSVLAYYRMHPFAGSQGQVESPAVTLGLGSYRVALGSRMPLRVNYSPGKLEVYFENSVRIGVGGSLVAVRLAVEDSTILEPKESCGRGLGHLRASTSVALLGGFERDRILLVAYSPVSQGLGEFRARFPLRSASAVEDCGVERDYPVLPDLLRIPMPLGCHCVLEVKKGFFLLRK